MSRQSPGEAGYRDCDARLEQADELGQGEEGPLLDGDAVGVEGVERRPPDLVHPRLRHVITLPSVAGVHALGLCPQSCPQTVGMPGDANKAASGRQPWDPESPTCGG